MEDHESPAGELIVENLTWREQDILNLLAERLSNREIAERLVLAESTVKDYVGRILGKLHVKNRRQAVERSRELGILGSVVDSLPGRGSNLPSAPTPFIGRTAELEKIREEIARTRLLTLSGPGGMGKTRLAMKTAELVAADFREGSFFVSLAPIRSADHIVQAVAEALDFPLPTNEDPKSQLIRYLQKKNLFLVIDNFEHLLGGVNLVSEILRNTSDVKILATSRERLNLQSETNLSIAGMDVGGDLKAKDRTANDAISLFLSSAAKVSPGFDLSPEELTRIGQICQAVGGMPLAIELAASWLHVLSVHEIYNELRKGLDILETDVRDAPERHRSIRAVFDGSWSLLDSKEREIFMRLSIFKGGFSRQAAQQVAGASLRQVGELVNKSILKLDPETGRLEIHELLRQYAQEHLVDQPQAYESTKEACAGYYTEMMQDWWEYFKGAGQTPVLTAIEADIENVRAAWGYYLDERNASQLRKLVHVLWMVYWIRGWMRGGIELYSGAVDALAQAEPGSELQAVHAAALGHLGFFMTWVGLADQGYKLAKKSVGTLERLDFPVELAFAYHSLTLSAYYLDHHSDEKDAAQGFLRIVETSGDKWLQAYGLWLVSFAELRYKRNAEAKRLAQASLNEFAQIKNDFGIALCLTALAGLAIRDAEYVQAREFFTRCMQMADRLDFPWLSSNAIKYLGQVALLTGDIEEAHKHLSRSLRIAYDLGLDRDIANHLFNFARLRVAQDDLEAGVELLSLLLQQPASYQYRSSGGRIRDNASALLADLEKKLPPESYKPALERGESLDVDQVVIGLIGAKN